MVANPIRGQLNRENENFPVPFALENLALRDRFGSPVPFRASPPILHTQAINVVLTHTIFPAFRNGVHLYRQSPSSIRFDRVIQHSVPYRWRSLPGARQGSSSSSQGTVVVVPVANGCCLFRYHHLPMVQFLFASLSPEPLSVQWTCSVR